MVYRKIACLICLGLLLMLCSSGVAGQAAPDTHTSAPGGKESNTLNNTVQLSDINDIKPLEKIGVNPALYWYAALGAIVLMLIAAAWIYLKKRRKKIPEVVALISPEEAALNLLDNLQPLMNSDGKTFYFKLSMILREYIGRRFGVGAPENRCCRPKYRYR